MPITRPKFNYVVDIAMFALMGAMIFVGVIMGFFLASGPVVDEGAKYVWGLHRHQWGDIHMILSLFFVSFFLLHLLLHWNWIKGAARKLLSSPLSLLVVVLLPALLVLGAWSLSERDSPEYSEYGHRAGEGIGRVEDTSPPVLSSEEVVTERKQVKTVEINGRMSLQDVEKAIGIPAKKFADSLGLPSDASLEQNLGQLRRRYGFQMQQVRNLVTKFSGGEIIATDSDGAIHKTEQPRKRKGKENRGMHRQEINGRLTLLEVEHITGISAGAVSLKNFTYLQTRLSTCI